MGTKDLDRYENLMLSLLKQKGLVQVLRVWNDEFWKPNPNVVLHMMQQRNFEIVGSVDFTQSGFAITYRYNP